MCGRKDSRETLHFYAASRVSFEGSGASLRIQKGALRIRHQKGSSQDPWWPEGPHRIRVHSKVLPGSTTTNGFTEDP